MFLLFLFLHAPPLTLAQENRERIKEEFPDLKGKAINEKVTRGNSTSRPRSCLPIVERRMVGCRGESQAWSTPREEV